MTQLSKRIDRLENGTHGKRVDPPLVIIPFGTPEKEIPALADAARRDAGAAPDSPVWTIEFVAAKERAPQ